MYERDSHFWEMGFGLAILLVWMACTTATVGSRYRDYYQRRICNISDNHVQCHTRTNSLAIRQCNGYRTCKLWHYAFNFPNGFSCEGGWPKGNFINITLNCITETAVHTVAVCRKHNDEIYGQSIRCDEGRVINIISATVGYIQYSDGDDDDDDDVRRPTSHSEECTIIDHVCPQHTNNAEIMKCNGLPHCSLSHDAFNYRGNFTCDKLQKGNYIEVTYNCTAATTLKTDQLSKTIPVHSPTSTTNTLRARETSTTSVSNASSDAEAPRSSDDAGPIIGVSVGMGLLLLIVIVICIAIVIVVCRNRRKMMSSGPQHATNLRPVTTPNIYGPPNAAMSQQGTARDNVVEMNPVEPRPSPAVNSSDYANVPVSGGVYPSLPPDRASLSNDATLIDNDLYQRGSVIRNDASTDENNLQTGPDVTTSANNTYQEIQLPTTAFDPSTLYSKLTPTASR